MRTRSAILICAVVVLAGPGSAQTTFGISSPLNPQNISGYQGPFLWDNPQAPPVRYQQVYRNSDFPRMGGTPVLINEVSFDTSAAAINVSLANVQVDLSTTSAQPDGLSTTFSQNVGRDDSIVFSGPLHLQTSGFGAYEAHIFLQH